MADGPMACRSCRAVPREGARFCDACGSPLEAVDTATYKQVTVLFADVVRSMDIAAVLDIERLREVMTEFLEASSAVVRRYGGTVESTGDGVMALFGAPIAFEDHAFRACLAALAIQEEAGRVAAEVARRDGVTLQVRVGLDSGRVIAGEIGSGALGYAATGTHVGMAQRMESIAPPGAVMLSEATARLVENNAALSEPQWVHIKGTDEPVRAHRLLAIRPRQGFATRAEASLVGRRWEMAALDAILDRATVGRGGVVTVVGPPGIGKSRTARETAAVASRRGIQVHWAFCESHARDIAFGVVAQLVGSSTGVANLVGEAARVRLRACLPDADPQDVQLVEDLLGIADPEVTLSAIDPDARRRRLTALLNTASLARTEPALFVIEDAHWIDPASDSLLADFLAVIPRTPTMVLVSSRPEYQGALTRLPGAQTIALAPLNDSDTATLLGELLGSHSSVAALAAIITDRADGNPFFAEEMVRELVQRGVLAGERGGYVCRTDVAAVSVPATVEAAIAARIDRLTAPARRTLSAASVIGARFGAELLAPLGIDPDFDQLLDAELIDQVRFTPTAEYAFHHPLIRAVAYETQLKSDRAGWHRRLAAAIGGREPALADENSALIAEHLEAAGDLHAAYAWHMRAGAWLTDRDLLSARSSWERARRIADELPVDDTARPQMRIAPRTMLCATDYQDPSHEGESRFAELRRLCNAAGDDVSLAIAMTGLVTRFVYGGRNREASRLASEQMALLESIGDPTLTMPLAFAAFAAWFESGEISEISRMSQSIVDLAGGDPIKGAGFGVGSPLAIALAWRGYARWWQGRPGWSRDLDDAVAMARCCDSPAHQHAATVGGTLTWGYGFAILNGVLRADVPRVSAIEEGVRIAAASSNDAALSLAEFGLAIALLNRDAAVDRRTGLELMVRTRDTWLRKRVALQDVPITDLWIARERFTHGDGDGVIPTMRDIVDGLHKEERFGYGVWATGVFVETLLERGADGDIDEAQETIERLVTMRADQVSAIRDVTLLRLRALVARARGDDVAYRDLVGRYRAMAESLGFEGHIAVAEAM